MDVYKGFFNAIDTKYAALRDLDQALAWNKNISYQYIELVFI